MAIGGTSPRMLSTVNLLMISSPYIQNMLSVWRLEYPQRAGVAAIELHESISTNALYFLLPAPKRVLL